MAGWPGGQVARWLGGQVVGFVFGKFGAVKFYSYHLIGTALLLGICYIYCIHIVFHVPMAVLNDQYLRIYSNPSTNSREWH